MSGKGVKRASPGVDEEKNPLGDVDITDEDAVKLQDLQKAYHRVELGVGAFLTQYGRNANADRDVYREKRGRAYSACV
jgi:hypothetical protein